MKRYLLWIILGISISPAAAQYYNSGQDPASVRWKQIKSDRYRVIFPSVSEKDGLYLARILDLATSIENKSLLASVPRMPVILHAFSSRSNAVTAWAPRRIELYPVPPQDTYAEEWFEQLVIHEYRHAVQTAKMNRGFTKALYYMFGEQATGAILGLFIPTWFLEGDAVCAETGLSNSGRGRIPAFENVLRTQVLEKGIYRYDKASLGSYRTFVPDDYVLGYHLSAWGREQYGAGVWNEPLDRAAKYPFMIIPFNSGLKKNTGMYKRKFYQAALSDLKSRWALQESATDMSPVSLITKPDARDFTNYSLPVQMNDSTFLLCKESMNHRLRFVTVNSFTGREKSIFIPGVTDPGGIGYAEGIFVWTERRPDPRWAHRNYMVLRGFDMVHRKVFDITKKKRLYAPALSHNGTYIATVNVLPDSECSLLLVSTTGIEEKTLFRCNDRDFILEPTWSPDDTKILFIQLNKHGKSLCELDLSRDTLLTHIPPSFREIKNPFYITAHEIAFTADYSGIDNIYIYNCLDKTTIRVTSSRFGASQPGSGNDSKIIHHLEYTSDGMMFASTPFDPLTRSKETDVRDRSVRLYEALATQENCNIQDSMLNRPDEERTIAKYTRTGHLFNLHSWAPLSFTVSNLAVYPGVSVLSQNVLGTAAATAGYRWDYNEKTGKFYAGISYLGLYPVFSLDYSYGRRAGFTHQGTTGESSRFTWDESEATLSVSIPINLSRGRWTRNLNPRVSSSVTAYLHNSTTPSAFAKGYEWPVSYSLSGGNYYFESGKSLYPRWGQLFSITFKHTPFKGIDDGSIFASSGNLYFPGIFQHHGIWIYGAWQQRFREPGQPYYFANIISYPRGTDSANDDKAVSIQFNYKLPLFYPDWSIGSLAYLKRFKLNLFFDYAEGRYQTSSTYYSSTGAELTVDLHLLRFVFPFELGLRAGYQFQKKGTFYEFLYSVNI